MTSLRLCVRRSPVPPVPGAPTGVAVDVPSSVEYIEEAVALVTRHCLAGAEGSERLRFRVQVVLAEALANAILRGNAADPAKTVEVAATLTPELIRLAVTDQGAGFDPAGVPDPRAPGQLKAGKGRGLFLIRHLADEVGFNQQGNSIWMTFRR